MSRIRLTSDDFYRSGDLPPQQGDILVGAVARLVAPDGYVSSQWAELDEHVVELPAAPLVGQRRTTALRVAAGRALVMVTSHDCGLDKEWNAQVRRAIAQGIAPEVAQQEAETDATLDRCFQVSPLIDPASVLIAREPVDQGQLLAGRMVGYLPVPALRISDQEIVPESVVDLTYRATLDRLAYEARVSSVTEEVRTQLRYALARLDSLRSPMLSIELSRVVGQEVAKARVAKRNPLVVELTLADGNVLRLLQEPGSPEPGPGRTTASVPAPDREV